MTNEQSPNIAQDNFGEVENETSTSQNSIVQSSNDGIDGENGGLSNV